MAGTTAEKPKSVAEKRKEKESAKSNGRAEIDKAHEALGTKPDEVPGANIDHGPQEVYDGDPEGHDVAQSASGAPTQLSFAVGGKKPTTSGLRLTGGKLDIEQAFSKGQTIELRIEAQIREIAFVDQVDSETGQVIGSERRHTAHIVGVAVL